MHCYNVSVLNIGLFQFSSQISVTLVSILYTNNFLVRECFYVLVSLVLDIGAIAVIQNRS